MDKVYAKRTLKCAWEHVRQNGGAAGMDKQAIDFFAKDAAKRLDKLHRELNERKYWQSRTFLRLHFANLQIILIT